MTLEGTTHKFGDLVNYIILMNEKNSDNNNIKKFMKFLKILKFSSLSTTQKDASIMLKKKILLKYIRPIWKKSKLNPKLFI